MKIILYLFLAIGGIIAAFLLWFFAFYMSIPELRIPDGTSEPRRFEIIDNWFQKLNEENKFNGTVLMTKDGEALLQKAYGFTNHKKNEKLTIHSSMRLASVSKQFTAAGIMLLSETGKLKYEDLVSHYLKGFPYSDVTIRNLLNQTSGVPDVYMDLAEENKESIDILTNEIAVNLVIKAKEEPNSLPNEKFEYSNTNYILLARIVEVVSGLSFESFMKEKIFDPLGMKDTRVWNLLSEDDTFKNKADDFVNFKGIFKELKPSFIDGVAGDGAVHSSVSDMLIWDQFWYDNPLLSKDNIQEAFKMPIMNDGSESDYGFGWVITDNGMWHNGAWLGARTVIIRNVEKKVCIVLLDNSLNAHFDKIVNMLQNPKR